MIINRYLIVGKRQYHYKPTVRVTTGQPKLDSHEVAMKLTLDIPDEVFQKPLLQANILIPKEAVSAPVITAEITNNIQALVSKELGVDLTISVIENVEAVDK